MSSIYIQKIHFREDDEKKVHKNVKF